MPETVVSEKPSATESPLSAQKPLTLGRRKFLKIAAALAGATLIGHLPERSAHKPSIAQLKERVEKRFNIKLLVEIDVLPGPTYRTPTMPYWNRENLAFLEKALELLPDHFYQPDQEGQPAGIILGEKDGDGLCNCGGSTYPNSVNLGIAKADPEIDFNKYMLVVVHEFTHLVASYSDRQKGLLTKPNYVQKVEQILGTEFSTESERLRTALVSKLRPLLNDEFQKNLGLYRNVVNSMAREGLSEQEKDRFHFLARFHFGLLNMKDMEEFLAVMGEVYLLWGKENFKKYYGEFFAPEVTENLYNFMKQEIFRGREY